MAATTSEPIVIKKYANRRLYNTGTSTYVTLDDLAELIKSGTDFVVLDAKSGEDITRSVLTQIIFEQEGKTGQSLLPITFLRQLIRFYGDSMQTLVPRYLEVSIESLTREQERLRSMMANTFGVQALQSFEEHARNNMAMVERAFRMFTPFSGEPAQPAGQSEPRVEAAAPESKKELEDLRAEMAAMKARLDQLADRKA